MRTHIHTHTQTRASERAQREDGGEGESGADRRQNLICFNARSARKEGRGNALKDGEDRGTEGGRLGVSTQWESDRQLGSGRRGGRKRGKEEMRVFYHSAMGATEDPEEVVVHPANIDIQRPLGRQGN